MNAAIEAGLQATLISKCALALLLFMPVSSWVYMCGKWRTLRPAQRRAQNGLITRSAGVNDVELVITALPDASAGSRGQCCCYIGQERGRTDMRAASRGLPLLFSLGMHVLLLGGILLLPSGVPDHTEKVFRVALVEFAPAPAISTSPSVAIEPPAPPSAEPQVQKPHAQAHTIDAPKPDIKRPSPKTSNKPVVQKQAATLPPPPPAPIIPSGPQPAPIASSGPQPRTIGGISVYESDVLDLRPSITRRVEPEYPTRARRMNVQGSVNVRLVVDSSGQPRNCEVVSATPHGYFEESALKAAQNMRFAPGKLKGQPVSTVVVLPFIFRLR